MVIVTEGLAKGDQLVVRGHRDLRDGSLVKITETAETADGSTAGDPATVTGAEVGSRVPSRNADASAVNDADVEASR